MIKNGMRPIHPGEILREDYLIPLGLSVNALANALHVPATRLHEIVKERRSVTPDTAALFRRRRSILVEFANRLRFAGGGATSLVRY